MKNLMCLFLILFSVSAGAVTYGPFVTFTDQFKDQKGSKVEIEDMPALKSQDSIGVCYASVAATLLNFDNCRQINRLKGTARKCSTVPEEELFSSLGLARYGGNPVENEGLHSSFQTLNITNGGNVLNTLIRMYNLGSAPGEACLSIDKVLSKVGGAEGINEAQKAVWNQLETLHGMAEGQTAELSVKKYGSLVQKCLGVQVSNEAMLRAFGEATYAGFLDKLLIDKKCSRARFRGVFEGKENTELGVFPEKDKKTDFKGAIAKIQSTLKAGYPMALNGICLDDVPKPIYKGNVAKKEDIPKDFCQEPHAVVISGYKRVCAGKECYDAVKVINSWGKAFQKSIDDGWVKADFLLNRTNYEEGTLAWIQDKAAASDAAAATK